MHALYSTRKTDDEYATMELPAAEYRVLALFRLWNAVQFFFAYKHLLNKPWDKVLVEYIPKYDNCGNTIAKQMTDLKCFCAGF
jgi:hypothetical protein